MRTALAFLFFPACACILIVLGLIFADGNPWGRRETPMLEQLAGMGLTDLEADPVRHDDDFDAPDWQAAWEARLDQQYSGAEEDGDCVQCGLNQAVCHCEFIDGLFSRVRQ